MTKYKRLHPTEEQILLFRNEILKLVKGTSYEHANECKFTNYCSCLCPDMYAYKHIHGCPSLVCDCNGKIHGIGLKK